MHKALLCSVSVFWGDLSSGGPGVGDWAAQASVTDQGAETARLLVIRVVLSPSPHLSSLLPLHSLCPGCLLLMDTLLWVSEGSSVI